METFSGTCHDRNHNGTPSFSCFFVLAIMFFVYFHSCACINVCAIRLIFVTASALSFDW